MSANWVPYKDGSAVQEAIAMANGLISQGVQIKPMHQGYEETEPEGALDQFRKYQDRASGKYQPATGHKESTEAFAAFAAKFLGLPSDRAGGNCFALQTNGRVGLGHAFSIVANFYAVDGLNHISALVPSSRWPMVDSKATQARLKNMVEYDVSRGKIAENIIAALDADDGKDRIAVLYTNFPHNPTGLASSGEEIARVQKKLDELNMNRAARNIPPIVHIADDPYFMGLPQNDATDKNNPVFQSPYAGNFQIDGPTPSIHIVSFSKALATASPGFHGTFMTNSDMAKGYGKFLATDLGPSFAPDFMNQIAAMLQEDFHDALREHFLKIHKKYAVNNPIFESHDSACVDGDPGMTRVLRVPEEALGKRISVNGETREIKTTRDVCAYIANTTGTILVAQAESGREDLIRAALKSENPDMIEEGSKDIAKALDDLASAAPISEAA